MLHLSPRKMTRAVSVAAVGVVALTASLLSPANADETYRWPLVAVCVGNGDLSGETVALTVDDTDALGATRPGEDVRFRIRWHYFDPAHGGMWWKYPNNDESWLHYKWVQNGNEASGSVTTGPDGTTVVVGGVSSPGVWRQPFTETVPEGKWVMPYVESWTQSSGYMIHPVGLDANSVLVDQTYGCGTR